VNMPSVRSEASPPGLVAYLGCQGERDMPWSEIDAAVASDGGAPHPQDADTATRMDELVSKAAFAVVNERCQNRLPWSVQQSFVAAPRWGDLTLWVRR
jgi:hypothetical protein